MVLAQPIAVQPAGESPGNLPFGDTPGRSAGACEAMDLLFRTVSGTFSNNGKALGESKDRGVAWSSYGRGTAHIPLAFLRLEAH